MPDDFLNNYQVLGLRPGVSWKQLRQTYKKLVNTWHPDRFQQDAQKKHLAEEKTKQITQAYKELSRYHKTYGTLPMPESRGMAPIETPASAAPEPDPDANRVDPETESVPEKVADEARLKDYLLRRPHILAVLALLLGVYLVWLGNTPQKSFDPGSKTETSETGRTDTGEHARPSDTTSAEKRFSVGSSLGDVIAIQGVPSRTEIDVWHYGNSKIYFSDGKVTSWEEHTDNPLRADIMQGIVSVHATFSRGSSKKEVRAVQGVPDRDNGISWDYGLSRVYFENDRVTNWQESPINPLRVRR